MGLDHRTPRTREAGQKPVVCQEFDGWFVLKGMDAVAGPFATNAEAWRWMDQHDAVAVDDEERRKRIGAAIGQW